MRSPWVQRRAACTISRIIPGVGGKMLFLCSCLAVMVVGGLMLDAVELKQAYQS